MNDYARDLRMRQLRTLVQYHGNAAHVHKISNRVIKNLLNAKQPNNPRTLKFGHTFGHVVGSPMESLRNHNGKLLNIPPIKSKFMSLDDMYIITDHALRSTHVEEAMEALGCYKHVLKILQLIPMKELNLPKKFYAMSFDTETNQPIGEKWEIEYIVMNLKPYFYEYYIPVDKTDDDNGNGCMASVGINTMYPLRAVEYERLEETMEIKIPGGKEIVPWATRDKVFDFLELRPEMARRLFL